MASRTENDSLVLCNLGLKEVQTTYLQNNPPRFSKYTNIYRTDVQSTRIAVEGDFPFFTPINQGTALEPTQYSVPYVRDYTTFKYGRIFEWDGDMNYTDVYNRIQPQGKKLMKAGLNTYERVAASMFQLANTSAIVTPDGVNLASTAHPTQTGTYSNYASGNAFTTANLTIAVASVMQQPTYTGEPLDLQPPWNLLVPPGLADVANRVIGSKLLQGGNANDYNEVGTNFNGTVTTGYFTNATLWALVPARKDENPLNILEKRPLTMKAGQADGRYDSNFITCVFSIGVLPRDWRGTYFAGA